MTSQLVGVLMMCAPVLWLMACALRAIYIGRKDVEFNVFALAIATAVWMIGRVIAGKSMFDLLLA
jgi:hypothetical protein